MHPLAIAQETCETGCVSITVEERARMRRVCRFPGDPEPSRDPRFYPRRPVVDVKRWREDHAAKLAGLERAEREGR
jgi:hypothetical protein